MLFFKAIVPESCAGQLAKAASQSCCPKLLPESCNSSNIYPKTSPQSYSAKRLPKPPQKLLQKLLPPKAAPRKLLPKRFPKKLFSKAPLQSVCPKAAMLQTCSQSYSAKRRKLLPKLLPKAARKLRSKLPKAEIFHSCRAKLLLLPPKLFPCAAPQSCAQSCSPSCCPKAAILQTCLPKPSSQSHSAKRLRKAASQSC